MLDEGEPHEIASWGKQASNEMINKRKEAGLSIREIEQITDISIIVSQTVALSKKTVMMKGRQ